jgi:Excreted virulence factor EspC, type VII ESX diderm
MAAEYEVLTEALREHAKKVDRISDRLAEAVDAAREIGLPTDSYGAYCQTLPMMLTRCSTWQRPRWTAAPTVCAAPRLASGQPPWTMRTWMTPTR